MLEFVFDARATKRGRVSMLCGLLVLPPAFAGSAQAQSASGATALPPVVVEQSRTNKRQVTPSRSSRSANVRRTQSRAAGQAPQAVSQPAGAAAERGTDPVRGFVPVVSSAAMKSDTPILETPQSVSVVSRDQLDARSVTTLVEGLQYVAGLAIQPGGKDPRFDNVFIRGFDNNGYGAYRDGLREVGDPNSLSLFRNDELDLQFTGADVADLTERSIFDELTTMSTPAVATSGSRARVWNATMNRVSRLL